MLRRIIRIGTLPEIMIPLVGDVKELKFVKKIVVETADAEIAAAGSDLKYEVGTMIEIPRAALTADEIAKEAEFFCFGTNDLTQMTYGFSRDDAGKFLDAYYDAKIFENDPFARLDQTGVGKLMKMAIELGSRQHVRSCTAVSAASTAATRLRRVLPRNRSGLCFLLSVPCADRKTGCCTGCNQEQVSLIRSFIHAVA